jgi:hypothetical protein
VKRHKEKSIPKLERNKGIVLTALCLALVCLLQAGCSTTGPIITFENEVLDFGQVKPGSNNIGEFKFANTGEELLSITNVERCCGVAAKLDKTEYEPGQSGALQVTYPAARMPSVVKRTVYVNTNDKNNPRIPLTIKAEIVMGVTWEPKTIKLSPDMENARCPEITIKSVDSTKKFSIRRFESTAGCVTATIDPSAQAEVFNIQPRVDLSKLEEHPRGSIIISVIHSEPNEPPETVTISYIATERFSLSPRSLYMFYSDPDKPIIRRLKITKNYGEDFKVVNISSKSKHIKVLGEQEIESGYQFELEISPMPVDEKKGFNDTLALTLNDGQRIEVSCRGIYSEPDEEEE